MDSGVHSSAKRLGLTIHLGVILYRGGIKATGVEDLAAEKCVREETGWPTLNLEKQLYLKGVQAQGSARGRPGMRRVQGPRSPWKVFPGGTVVPGPSAAGEG